MWRKAFPLWKEFKAQWELGAWLTIKLGKTRLKWQLACGEEPSLLRRTGIWPLTGTAVDKTEQSLVPTAFILQRINSNNSARTRRNNRRCNWKISSKQLTYIWFLQPLKTKEYNRNILKQISLRIKWKLNTNSIFNLKSFVTVAILESKSTETKT